MWCTVYVLYSSGEPVPIEKAKANGLYGWLRAHSKDPILEDRRCAAYLLPSPYANQMHSILPPLYSCSLRAIDGGIRLNGSESCIGNPRHSRQSWWVIPGEHR